MSDQLARLFYIACELRPALPPTVLGRHLGKVWWPLVQAGANAGIAGTPALVSGVSGTTISEFHMMGSQTGSQPTLDEFYTGMAGVIYENIRDKSDLSAIEQIMLMADLKAYISGQSSHNGDGIIDFDAEVETPVYTPTGFWPLDRICGEEGPTQGIATILAKPEQGKTTILMSIAHEWRRRDIGPVHFIQVELPQSLQVSKIRGMGRPGESLWRRGIDQMVFGSRTADQHLQWLINNPDPTRLVLWDSLGAHCGGGDTSDSRNKFFSLYMDLMAVKNVNRMVVTAGHIKRGADPMDIENAAGSAAIERYSDYCIVIEKDPSPWPGGRNSIRILTTKNRHHARVRPFDFIYDYKTGQAFDEAPEIEEEVLE